MKRYSWIRLGVELGSNGSARKFVFHFWRWTWTFG